MGDSWGADGSQLYPPSFCPWSKITLGWLTPIDVVASGTFSMNSYNDNPTVYKISIGFPFNEYLLLENRRKTGFELDIPQAGILIWHIDDSSDYDTEGYPGQSGWPANGNHYR
jgi:immune inhibitor A